MSVCSWREIRLTPKVRLGQPLPGVATVALQRGRYVADTILARVAGREVPAFSYWDKGANGYDRT